MTRAPSKQIGGAFGKAIRRSDVESVGAGYVLQPKLDGWFTQVSFDAEGKLSTIATRGGKLVGIDVYQGLAGAFEDIRYIPNTTIAAEIELGTDAAEQSARLRGYRLFHAFDVLKLHGRELTGTAYADRREALYRAHAEQELNDYSPYIQDASGRYRDSRATLWDRPWVPTRDQLGKSSRIVKPVPMGCGRISIVPQLPVAKLDQAWSSWVVQQEAGPCEGLVMVAPAAKLGKAKSKIKVKEADTIDCVVTDVGARSLTAYWGDAKQRITVSRQPCDTYRPGEVIEIKHEGFMDSMQPRFARIVRHREDLS